MKGCVGGHGNGAQNLKSILPRSDLFTALRRLFKRQLGQDFSVLSPNPTTAACNHRLYVALPQATARRVHILPKS
jgi:hypothetical protein